MSFTLRNLFSEDDGDAEAGLTNGSPESGSRESAPANAGKTAEEGPAYLVSELLPFIPPAIAASEDIPMEKEVVIPMLKEGTTDVTLSAIYRSCPELFDAEITPLNDSVVTLPRKTEEAKDPAPAAESATSGDSIFDAPSTPFGAPGFGFPEAETDSATKNAEDNPFWSPDSAGATETDSAEPPSGDGAFPTGFSDVLPAEVSAKDEGAAREEPSMPEKKPQKTIDEAMAGFEAPPAPNSDNPFGDPSGPSDDTVGAGFSENPFDSDESFSTLFSDKAEEDSNLPFPSQENGDSTWGAMFESDAAENVDGEAGETGFGEMMQKSDPAKAEAEVPAAKDAFSPEDPPQDPFAQATPDPDPEKSAPKTSPAISFTVAKPAANKEPVPPAEEPAPAEKTFKPLRSGSSPSAASSVKVEEEQLAPMTSPIPGEVEVSLRDLEFRALFSSDESFTLAKVAREVVAFEGVAACALATTVKLVQASRNEQSRLGDEAREMVDAIRNLAKLTGLPEARAFTLQTDRGTVSLFLEGDCCVTVNHQPSGFGPGVREKLILVARNIHKLQE